MRHYERAGPDAGSITTTSSVSSQITKVGPAAMSCTVTRRPVSFQMRGLPSIVTSCLEVSLKRALGPKVALSHGSFRTSVS
jgi:hypothetical protein